MDSCHNVSPRVSFFIYISFPSFLVLKPFATFLGVFLFFYQMSGNHEYGTIAVTQMFAAVRGHNLQRLSYVTDCR